MTLVLWCVLLCVVVCYTIVCLLDKELLLKANDLCKKLGLEWKEFFELCRSVGYEFKEPTRKVTVIQAVEITEQFCRNREASEKETEETEDPALVTFWKMCKYTLLDTAYVCLCFVASIFLDWLFYFVPNWLQSLDVLQKGGTIHTAFLFFGWLAPWILLGISTIMLMMDMGKLLHIQFQELFLSKSKRR